MSTLFKIYLCIPIIQTVNEDGRFIKCINDMIPTEQNIAATEKPGLEFTVLLKLPDGATKASARDRVLLSVLYASGARAQEFSDYTEGIFPG